MAQAKKTPKKTTKKAAKKTTKAVDPLQTDIPGSRKVIQEVEDAAVEYAKAAASAERAKTKKSHAKATLIQKMHTHKIVEYRLSDGRLAKLSPREDGVTVKAYKE